VWWRNIEKREGEELG